jgi:TonB family protein
MRGPLLVSLGLHGALFVLVLTYTLIARFHLNSGGGAWGASDATHVGAVSSLPGVPLPSPLLQTRSTVVTQNTGIHQTEHTKEEPAPEAQPIPRFKDSVKLERLQLPNKRIHKDEDYTPPNAVPYGERGGAQMNYTQVVTGSGTGGVALGEGNAFGQRYAYYVAAMRARISGNWLQSTVSPNIISAPRVYLTFQISRDGSISDVQLTQSSGVAEVDRSALRAILASNPLPPLPNDYSGGSIGVQFYFDFHR